ncbi:electron transfer flavoprotein alpha subunit apoprotein [Sanguibacter gelidistatuariae]|uniref:Electron transfer flavoprotein alpha subunit apoprotein n=1 Tax=Sanguibacter gelidistatuariae TaxID=1814289 RepID=A0A1G6VFB2_9MICO|nr:electron transfer flavoprotein subunit alpha/FixB family protein [Sanguibacter gelidistatuariae]SDD52053.1 electron transfer flavoprotein alpha subunit apoprotein [Sanguibacter gelidistatuariae]
MADSTPDPTTAGRTVLVVLDRPDRGLRSPARELLTIARDLGEVTAFAIAEPSQDALAELGAYGVGHVLVADIVGDSADAHLAHLTPVAAEALVAAVASTGADVVLLSSSFLNREVGAHLAHAIGAGLVLDTSAVSVGEQGLVGDKRVFAGSWDVSCAVTTAAAVVTVRANAVVAAPAAEPVVVQVDRIDIHPSAAATATVLVSRTEHAQPEGGSGRPALAEAAYVVAGGRGTLGDFAPVEDLADALGAAVGATRDAVDEGWVTHDAQIGQTGVTIAPRVYIGAGISGAPHHRGGMQASGVIIAVNNDPDSPIFEIADFGVVGDLAEVLPQAAQAIRAHRG